MHMPHYHRQHFHIGNGSYFGGKGASGVVHHIINQIRLHQTFVSGFLGRCAVMRWKLPAKRSIGFEIDPVVFNKWFRVFQHDIELYNADFLEVGLQLPELQSPDTFLYLDPPYLIDTRSSLHRYPFEMTEAQHLFLLQQIKTLPCMVAISCYDSELYNTELEGWRKITFPSQTRGGVRTETLYMNYPEPAPDSLHDKAFLGRNFRAREKTKRRITTIKNKIKRLEAQEMARLRDWLQDLVTSQEPELLEAAAVPQDQALPDPYSQNYAVFSGP